MHEDGIVVARIDPNSHVEICTLSSNAEEAVCQIAEILGFPSDAPARAFPKGYTKEWFALTVSEYKEYLERLSADPLADCGFDRWYPKHCEFADDAMMIWYDHYGQQKGKTINFSASNTSRHADDWGHGVHSSIAGTAVYSGYDLGTKEIRSVPLGTLEYCMFMEACNSSFKDVRAWRVANGLASPPRRPLKTSEERRRR